MVQVKAGEAERDRICWVYKPYEELGFERNYRF